jgi:hypothetical protein
MLAIKQWTFMITLVCLAALATAEDRAMSTQEQCAEYGVYKDATENWIDCAAEAYVEEAYVEDTYVEEPYIEDTYVEEPYAEEPYVEDSYVDEPYTETLNVD